MSSGPPCRSDHTPARHRQRSTTGRPSGRAPTCEATGRRQLLLPTVPAAAGAARAFARRALCPDHASGLLDDALLLISELVTNSVVHGSPPVLMSVECTGDGLEVRVRDGAPALPQRRGSSAEDEGGRGLVLLEELSHAWGSEPVDDEHGSGKAVWFALRAPR